MKTQQIDVTKSTQRVGEFVRGLSPITQPIEILLEGKVVGRVVPPGELSEAEKEDIVRKGRHLLDCPGRCIGRDS